MRSKRKTVFSDADGPLHEWERLDEKSLRDFAAQYVGWATNEMSAPEDLYWQLENHFELATIIKASTDWDEYHHEELRENPRYDDEFEGAHYHTPVVISLEAGGPVIWDGWHRISCAINRGDRTIMAIVGRRSDD